MTVTIDGGAGVTFPDGVQQTNGMTMTGGTPKYYAARAWVSFDGTGTVNIRAASGVSSITDLGTGRYRVNLSPSMPDVNYAVSGQAVRDDNTQCNIFGIAGSVTTGSVTVQSKTDDGVIQDSPNVSVVIHR